MRFVLPVLFVILSGIARADTTAELFDQLKSAAKAEIKDLQDNKDAATQQRFFQLQQTLSQLVEENTLANGYNSVHTLEAIGMISTSDKLTAICGTLAKQLRAEKEQRETAQIEAMQKSFSEALRTALNATSAKELDQPLRTVGELLQTPNAENYGNPNTKLRTLFTIGQQLSEFLREWQDYLSGIYANNNSNSRSRLQNLLSNNRDFSILMPRSEFLALLAKARGMNQAAEQGLSEEEVGQKAREILGTMHSLADIEGGLQKLDELAKQRDRSSSSANGFLANTQNTLRYLQKIYVELNNGLSTNISIPTITANFGSNDSDGAAALRAQLLLYALQRLLGVGNEDAARPGENVATYLHRISVAAREKSDWTLLSKTIDTAQTLNVGSASNTSDRTALQSFLGGINQERARQYAFAVSSFQAALKSGSQLISAEMIGDHLEKIRQEHPQEFEQGIQIALNPPVTSDLRFTDPRYRMMPPGFPGGPPPQPTPPPSLTVPPVSAKTVQPAPTPAVPPAPKANDSK